MPGIKFLHVLFGLLICATLNRGQVKDHSTFFLKTKSGAFPEEVTRGKSAAFVGPLKV